MLLVSLKIHLSLSSSSSENSEKSTGGEENGDRTQHDGRDIEALPVLVRHATTGIEVASLESEEVGNAITVVPACGTGVVFAADRLSEVQKPTVRALSATLAGIIRLGTDRSSSVTMAIRRTLYALVLVIIHQTMATLRTILIRQTSHASRRSGFADRIARAMRVGGTSDAGVSRNIARRSVRGTVIVRSTLHAELVGNIAGGVALAARAVSGGGALDAGEGSEVARGESGVIAIRVGETLGTGVGAQVARVALAVRGGSASDAFFLTEVTSFTGAVSVVGAGDASFGGDVAGRATYFADAVYVKKAVDALLGSLIAGTRAGGV